MTGDEAESHGGAADGGEAESHGGGSEGPR